MLVYWMVWFAVLILAGFCKAYDFYPSQELTESRVYHGGLATFFFLIASIMLIIVAGCRYYVGADFGAYYKYKNYLDFLPSIKALDEPGIRVIYNIAVLIHRSGGMCIMAAATVTLGLELSALYKNTDNIGFALPLFVFTCWTSCFNGVRQDLAVAVLFCGLPALREKNFKKYAFIVFLAFLCHRSAIIMILVYFIVNRKVNARNVIILIVASVIVLLSYDKVYNLVNTVLLDHDVTGQEAYWGTVVNIYRVLTYIVPAAFFLYMYRYAEKDCLTCFYLNLLLIHAIVGAVTMNSAALARMVMYTMPFAVVAMAELLKRLSGNNRRIYSCGIVILFWIMQIYEVANSNSLSPFRLKWFW